MLKSNEMLGSFICQSPTKMPQSEEEGQVPFFKIKNFTLLSSNWQDSIFSGQIGRSRGTVIEDKAVTFQVVLLWIYLKIKEEMSTPKKERKEYELHFAILFAM
jgi:hypothetical protein